MKRLILTIIITVAMAGASACTFAAESHFGRMAFIHHQSPSQTSHFVGDH